MIGILFVIAAMLGVGYLVSRGRSSQRAVGDGSSGTGDAWMHADGGTSDRDADGTTDSDGGSSDGGGDGGGSDGGGGE